MRAEKRYDSDFRENGNKKKEGTQIGKKRLLSFTLNSYQSCFYVICILSILQCSLFVFVTIMTCINYIFSLVYQYAINNVNLNHVYICVIIFHYHALFISIWTGLRRMSNAWTFFYRQNVLFEKQPRSSG